MCYKGQEWRSDPSPGGAQKIVSWIPDIARLEFDFDFDCDCVLIFFPLEESILVEPTVKGLLVVKRL